MSRKPRTEKRPRWHIVYYVLAAIDLVTIGGSLSLNHEVTGIYAESVASNQEWAGRVMSLIELGGLAQKVNAPGNDVFDSRDVASERTKRNQALGEFADGIKRVEDDIRDNVDPEQAVTLVMSLALVRESMASMTGEADRIFDHFQNGQEEEAGRRMATMDRRYGEVTTSISGAIGAVQSIQASNFAAQQARASDIRRFEYAIGGVIFLIVIAVALYGHKIAGVFRRHAIELEEERRKAEAASVAKSQFLASMSHEIRTPMNGVLGMVNTLLGTKLSAAQRQSVDIIKESGEALLAILNDILDISKIEAGRIELEQADFSVRRLVSTCEALWASKAINKGLSFSVDIGAICPDVVVGDAGRLRQTLFNLIGNAVKFTQAGSVTVTVRGAVAAGGRARLRFEVSDTGIGLSEESRAKLFAPFVQADASTSRRFGGTGLGLAISKQLIEQMGGKIGVESTLGQGSTFWVTLDLPLGDPSKAIVADSVAADVPRLAAPGGRALRLLVAEDNHINQLVVRNMLEALDCTIDMVGNGSEAVLAASKTAYDLILMDVQMPELDGPDATRKIRAKPGPNMAVPIIALTANAMAGDRERYLAAGMTDYVSKPIDAHELYAAIARCLPEGEAVPSHTAEQPLPIGEAAPERPKPPDDATALALEALIGKATSLRRAAR